MNKKRGIFFLHDHILRDAINSPEEKHIALFHELFSIFIPVTIHYDFMRQGLDYVGYSELFDEVEDGVAPSRYDVIFTNKENGDLMFWKFQKQMY